MATTCCSTAASRALAYRRTGSWWISCASRTANWPNTGTLSRTRGQRKHPSEACPCWETALPPDSGGEAATKSQLMNRVRAKRPPGDDLDQNERADEPSREDQPGPKKK